MSQWHRDFPELAGTDQDPWMSDRGYAAANRIVMRAAHARGEHAGFMVEGCPVCVEEEAVVMDDYRAQREPMIRAAREALDRHEHAHADNDGRAVAVVLAVEPLVAEQLRGAVEDRDVLRKLVSRALDGLECDSEDERRAVFEEVVEALDPIDGER